LIECPRITFPFLRRIVSDVTRDGGFPPLNLETIDFMELYRSEISRRVEENKAKAN
jgi:preprotein translocase subunit SecB